MGVIVLSKEIDALGLILDGSNLSASEAEQMEESLKAMPNAESARFMLLGYYFPKYIRSRKADARRKEHLVWVIDHFSNHEVLTYPFCLVLKTLDPEFYEKCKSLWLSKVEHAVDSQTIVNAVAQIAFCEPEAARRLVKDVVRDRSLRRKVLRLIERLEPHALAPSAPLSERFTED